MRPNRSAFGLVMVIVVPLGVAAFVAFKVYQKQEEEAAIIASAMAKAAAPAVNPAPEPTGKIKSKSCKLFADSSYSADVAARLAKGTPFIQSSRSPSGWRTVSSEDRRGFLSPKCKVALRSDGDDSDE